MAREKPTYRLELEQILAFFPGKRLLTISDVAKYLGRSRNWVRENVTREDVSTIWLANWLAK